MGKLSKLGLIKSVFAVIFIAFLCCAGCAQRSANMTSIENPGIETDPGSYDAYTGKYWHTPYSINVTQDGDTLYAQKKGEKKYEIYPKSEDTFYYKAIDAHITFNRKRDGMVKSLSLHQYGDVMQATKVK